jgi:hypothetical protein
MKLSGEPIWLISNEKTDRTVWSKATDGSTVLPIFKSKEAAERFIKATGLNSDHEAHALEQEGFRQYLEAVGKQGVKSVMVDPDPKSQSNKPLPILALLMEMED